MEESSSCFSKSASAIKRNIININNCLPEDKQFHIEGSMVTSRINYSGYLDFVSSISLSGYLSSQEERTRLLLVYSILKSPLNKTSLYESIHVSTTTLKKDTREFKSLLMEEGLHITPVPKRGIVVEGCERRYRFLCTKTLHRILEIDDRGVLGRRQANSPLEKLLAGSVLDLLRGEAGEAVGILKLFTQKRSLRISYSSKKFVLIYLTLALYRSRRGFCIDEDFTSRVETGSLSLLGDNGEDAILATLLSSLDYSSAFPPPPMGELQEAAGEFIEDVQKHLVTRLRSHNSLLDEVSRYLYKSILRNDLNYGLFDDKIEDTHKVYENLYNITRNAVHRVEERYGIALTYAQTATLTLILKKYITLSKVAGRNKVRVVILTNSAIEKIDFFIERLKVYVDLDVIESININELKLLEDLDYQVIITFSNRIKSLLMERGLTCIKLPFHLQQKDIDILLDSGFSRSHRKLLSEEVAGELAGKSQREITELLQKKYSDYFI